MPQYPQNPFNVTKSVDFTDDEIAKYWVDFDSEGAAGNLLSLLKPSSRMPIFILGSKGSGKTHLMRYMSYQLQCIRGHAGIANAVADDGYIGIYTRFGGLNSSRFKGKGQPDDAWDALFAYHFELWLAQIALEAVGEIVAAEESQDDFEVTLCKQILDLFDEHPPQELHTVESLLSLLRELQRQVDVAVNNAALTRQLSIPITVTPGALLFGIPQIVSKVVPQFKKVAILYLLDEFENLTDRQQIHINTLVRDRSGPCSFRIGSRLYGIRSHETNSAEEENKEGSEFETLDLDDWLRKNEVGYKRFAKRLLAKRISPSPESDAVEHLLANAFELGDVSVWYQETAKMLLKQTPPANARYFARLRESLKNWFERSGDQEPDIANSIERIVSNLAVSPAPLLHK